MAWELHRHDGQESYKAASRLVPFDIVQRSATQGDFCLPVATTGQRPLGAVRASAPQAGHVAVHLEGDVVKAVAAASLGEGARVGFASYGNASAAQDNDVTSVVQLGPIAAASGVAAWQVGYARTAAAAGEIFSLEIKPEQLGGLA